MAASYALDWKQLFDGLFHYLIGNSISKGLMIIEEFQMFLKRNGYFSYPFNGIQALQVGLSNQYRLNRFQSITTTS